MIYRVYTAAEVFANRRRRRYDVSASVQRNVYNLYIGSYLAAAMEAEVVGTAQTTMIAPSPPRGHRRRRSAIHPCARNFNKTLPCASFARPLQHLQYFTGREHARMKKILHALLLYMIIYAYLGVYNA